MRRLASERGAEAATAALLGAAIFAMDAQQEAGAPAALRAMLAPAAAVAAAVLQHAAGQKGPPRLALTGLMAALAALLLDCSKRDLAAFTADLPTAEAALRCAVVAGAAAAARGTTPQRSALWGELLPAAFQAIRKLGACLGEYSGGAGGRAGDVGRRWGPVMLEGISCKSREPPSTCVCITSCSSCPADDMDKPPCLRASAGRFLSPLANQTPAVAPALQTTWTSTPCWRASAGSLCVPAAPCWALPSAPLKTCAWTSRSAMPWRRWIGRRWRRGRSRWRTSWAGEPLLGRLMVQGSGGLAGWLCCCMGIGGSQAGSQAAAVGGVRVLVLWATPEAAAHSPPLPLLLTHPPTNQPCPMLSCYRDRLAKEPPPDAATQAKLADLLGWLSKALQLLSLLMQHGQQMEAFLDDGGVMSLCLHLSKYPAIHAQLPPTCVAGWCVGRNLGNAVGCPAASACVWVCCCKCVCACVCHRLPRRSHEGILDC